MKGRLGRNTIWLGSLVAIVGIIAVLMFFWTNVGSSQQDKGEPSNIVGAEVNGNSNDVLQLHGEKDVNEPGI